jgi:hypothetical protein
MPGERQINFVVRSDGYREIVSLAFLRHEPKKQKRPDLSIRPQRKLYLAKPTPRDAT